MISPRYLEAWKHTLSLSNVRPGEVVCILIGPIASALTVETAALAASLLGAAVFKMELGETGVSTALSQNRAAAEALKNSDFVIDLMGMDRGAEQAEILKGGTRILLVKEPPETLMHMLPNPELRKKVLGAADRMRSAKQLRATSKSGTDLTVALGEYPLLIQYGYADEPSRWDHWPSAFVATWPNEKSATGRVVLSPGDCILPFKSYVKSPVTLDVKDGYITNISGDFDARYLRDYLDSFEDPEGYAVSHLGWGVHARAHWTALGLYDKRQTNGMASRSFAGNFMFSTGPNSEAGGNRHTPCHLDIPMLDCSVFLDGRAIVTDGQLLDRAVG
jgi:2,5-dihydroxypyridine 5,6-dioxygenase